MAMLVRCPNCGLRMRSDRKVFRRDFKCGQCGSGVMASESYGRLLWAISVAFSLGITWLGSEIYGISSFEGFLCALASILIVAILILSFLVRIAPLIVPPPLVIRRTGPPRVLGLRDDL
jgi:hypothetical protein